MDEQKNQIVDQRKQLDLLVKRDRAEREEQVRNAELEIREAKLMAIEEFGRLSRATFLRDHGVPKSLSDYEERLEAVRAQLIAELDKKIDKKIDRSELMAELERRGCKSENKDIYPTATRGIYPLPESFPRTK